MSDHPSQTIEYAAARSQSRAPRLIRLGALAGVAADIALLAAIFICNGGRIWGPYLYPPVTIYWAQPIAAVSMLFGLVGIFASGIGLMRPSLVAWKVVAAMASLGYLIGVVCVGVFGLL